MKFIIGCILLAHAILSSQNDAIFNKFKEAAGNEFGDKTDNEIRNLIEQTRIKSSLQLMNKEEKELIKSKIEKFRNEEISYYKEELRKQSIYRIPNSSFPMSNRNKSHSKNQEPSTSPLDLYLKYNKKIKELEAELNQEGEFYVFRPSIYKKHPDRKMYFYIGTIINRSI
jgi:hypothetical protein